MRTQNTDVQNRLGFTVSVDISLPSLTGAAVGTANVSVISKTGVRSGCQWAMEGPSPYLSMI